MTEPKQAKLVLELALDAIEKGAKKHGSTEPSFRMVAQLWTVYLDHMLTARQYDAMTIQPHDVAVMMSLLKIARATYSYSFDNYVDEAGYTALAALLHPQTTHAGKPDETV